MHLKPHEVPTKAVVVFKNFRERLHFGHAAPYFSQLHQRSIASRAPDLPYFFEPYSRNGDDYPQEQVIGHALLGHVLGNLSERSGGIAERAAAHQDMQRAIAEYFIAKAQIT